MKYVTIVATFLFGGFLMLHGLAHSPAVLGSWDLATFEDVSYQPNILLEESSKWIVRLLGVAWLIAGTSFVLAGIAFLRTASWWPQSLLAAIVVSMPLTALWWQDALVGLLINVGLIIVLTGILAWTTWKHHEPNSLRHFSS